MALKIRLTRTGAIHNPYYRVVVAEARSRRDGAPVEQLGTYAPCDKANQLNLKLDRIDYWLSKGAKPTDTLNSLIKKARKAPAPAVEATPVAEEVSA
ncbi:MAG: 30S ribosomal protein S16 [Opitutaceae bacterium]|mgnify:CR=1 FL=1|jgi:small subunit ribosomal protein S16|nr:30S ribosomal protein S16 [Opitutaceae bacterium]|tara:strand:+ start:1737 stop:2027 length:291 start_codon:yes stop_codon:yes gene_type:complete